MKSIKIWFFGVTAALLCAVLTACGGVPAPAPANRPDTSQAASPAGTDELDAAIREASTYLNGRVPKGSKAVFLNISSNYPDLSEYLLNVLSENAVNDGVFSVVDRQQLDVIRAELNFQMSEEVSVESAQSIGQMLGAQTIVSGAVSKIGSLYRVQVKAIEVQSAGVQGQWSRNIPNGATIAALTEKYAPVSAAIAAGASSARGGAAAASVANGGTVQAPVPEADAQAKTYKIGDAGPAGGIVFYDMGFYIDGWRYLEAAPQDFPNKASFGGCGVGTETGVGSGMQNTTRIVADLKGRGETLRAAQIVGVPQYGGYDDWFLPSRDELNLMYENLKQKRIGAFSNDVYWSSSCNDTYLYAWQINFSDGRQNAYGGVRSDALVRAIRRF
jgi:TolB-like protein